MRSAAIIASTAEAHAALYAALWDAGHRGLIGAPDGRAPEPWIHLERLFPRGALDVAASVPGVSVVYGRERISARGAASAVHKALAARG